MRCPRSGSTNIKSFQEMKEEGFGPVEGWKTSLENAHVASSG
jgi:hypothetical protein